MGIRFSCAKCGRRLNVKSFLAGKRGICPYCGDRLRIPMHSDRDSPEDDVVDDDLARDVVARKLDASPQHVASGTPVADQTAASAASGTPRLIAEAPERMWQVMPRGGRRAFGPAPGETILHWIRDGRVGADALVRREDWDNTAWQSAAEAFPEVADELPGEEEFVTPSIVIKTEGEPAAATATASPLALEIETDRLPDHFRTRRTASPHREYSFRKISIVVMVVMLAVLVPTLIYVLIR